MFPELSSAIERFRAEMSSLDEIAMVLLKGHLLLEESLTRILGKYVFHPEHLSEARLTFYE